MIENMSILETCSFIFERSVLTLERGFQPKLIEEIKRLLPGCLVLKNDANYMQGIPDLLILHGDRWALLECKSKTTASKRPNQDYYIDRLDNMSFARFICPERRICSAQRRFRRFSAPSGTLPWRESCRAR